MDKKKANQLHEKSSEQEPHKPGTAERPAAVQGREDHDSVGKSSPDVFKINHEHVMESDDLPELYGETRLMVLPVEPYLVHAYWEFSYRQYPSPVEESERAKNRASDDHNQTRPVLRFYDVTHIIFDGKNAHSFFDVDIDLSAQNWYVRLRSPDKSYLVELGFRSGSGRFFPAARSNVIETPRSEPVPEGDAKNRLVAEVTEEGFLKAEVHNERNSAEESPAKTATRTAPLKEGWPVQAASVHSRKSAEGPAESPLLPKVSSPQDIHVRYGKEMSSDLTDMSEEKLIFGVSSK